MFALSLLFWLTTDDRQPTTIAIDELKCIQKRQPDVASLTGVHIIITGPVYVTNWIAQNQKERKKLGIK